MSSMVLKVFFWKYSNVEYFRRSQTHDDIDSVNLSEEKKTCAVIGPVEFAMWMRRFILLTFCGLCGLWWLGVRRAFLNLINLWDAQTKCLCARLMYVQIYRLDLAHSAAATLNSWNHIPRLSVLVKIELILWFHGCWDGIAQILCSCSCECVCGRMSDSAPMLISYKINRIFGVEPDWRDRYAKCNATNWKQ